MNQSLWQKFKRVKWVDLLHIIIFVLAIPVSWFYRMKHKELWLICDLKGEILYRLGKGVRATSWWDNRYIVGMIDKDNGLEFIKSDIVVVDIKTGKKTLIDTDENIALYPCANKPYIEYFTLDNKKHTIKLKIYTPK